MRRSNLYVSTYYINKLAVRNSLYAYAYPMPIIYAYTLDIPTRTTQLVSCDLYQVRIVKVT